jgi:hypothetical protein
MLRYLAVTDFDHPKQVVILDAQSGSFLAVDVERPWSNTQCTIEAICKFPVPLRECI